MAPEGRQEDPGLNVSGLNQSGLNLSKAFDKVAARLRQEPYCFRFFQAVWLLERMRPDRAPVGHRDASREAARFEVNSSLVFPASEIQAIDCNTTPPRLMVNFMGLTGPSGVLPHVYTELIEERAKARDRSLRDFLDIFNHRLISLLYRAWKRYRFPVDGARFRRFLLSLAGLGTPGLERRQAVEDDSLLFYSGLLALQPRSAAALERILEDYFQVPAEVEQFVGAWYRLARDSTFRFEGIEEPSEALGMGVVVGDEVWDQQSRVRVRLGPLTMAQYELFLPGNAGFRRVRDLTRFFSRDELDFEVQLILRKEDVPGFRLEEDSPVRLGWTSWVKTQPVFPRDPADAVLPLQ